MRDIVEIGRGREAVRTHQLAEVSLVPTRRTRSSKDVDTTWSIDAYTFDVPFVSHPTDALAGEEFLEEFGKAGGLGVINAEGLWGRCADIEGAIDELVAKATSPEPESEAVAYLQQLHAQPIDHELLAQRIANFRATGQTVAVRVSPQHARELAPVVIKAGAEILFIQGTVISAEHVAEGGEPLNLKEFVSSLDVPVIAGGVYDYSTALHLMRTGAAGVIVGGGSNTNAEAMGIGTGMATAIADVAAARRDYLDETGGRYVHVLCDDREIISSADAVKAIACGADAVVLGEPLSRAKQAAGRGVYWTHASAHPRFPRGRVEAINHTVAVNDAEYTIGDAPVPVDEILHGPSTDTFGGLNFVGALKRAMGKCGYTDLKQFQKAPLTLSAWPL
ncbi:GuaB3 family IMP dehydrogenase-related protein [Corynebacterium mendelii]|uniref:GuaB3 family IMP dehydrogenase-related protein n=1 Tax=Corynebacterium mendelii TaxID=2765362 RepID=A0A939IX31_9CORY|nr:GuaB3 family IMP dehydrogenase-related protein [Corynebacterium mendelii]MBN9644060.1 GuaB3 family IMP dehydrogenase-related protein [Corynebacterium mendelii]